jgi:hypothetical protein
MSPCLVAATWQAPKHYFITLFSLEPSAIQTCLPFGKGLERPLNLAVRRNATISREVHGLIIPGGGRLFEVSQ